jgi:uncharacterized membrane protein YqjE
MSEPQPTETQLRSSSTSTLVGDLVTHITELLRKEIQLLRAEINEKTSQAITAVGMIVAGVVVALVALNVLAAALVVAVENIGIDAGWAAVIVGVVLGIVAFALTARGTSNLKATNLAPRRTARSAARDADIVKERM